MPLELKGTVICDRMNIGSAVEYCLSGTIYRTKSLFVIRDMYCPSGTAAINSFLIKRGEMEKDRCTIPLLYPESQTIRTRRQSTEQRRQRRLYCGTPGVSRRLWLGAHTVAGSSKAKDNAADQRRTSIRGRRRAPFGLLCTARGRCRWVIGPSRDALKVEEA
jgi:hypothetical protein